MPTDTFASFSRRVDQFIDGISDSDLKAVMTKLGVAAKDDALKAASADLGGDNMFTEGWSKAPLDTRFDHVGSGVISFHPTRRGAGPWTVAEFGRNAGEGPRMTGPRLTATGRVSKAKVRRWNGRTKGYGTASKALARIEAETPKRFEDELKKAIRKAFD